MHPEGAPEGIYLKQNSVHIYFRFFFCVVPPLVKKRCPALNSPMSPRSPTGCAKPPKYEVSRNVLVIDESGMRLQHLEDLLVRLYGFGFQNAFARSVPSDCVFAVVVCWSFENLLQIVLPIGVRP